jgi:hypothetical protein
MAVPVFVSQALQKNSVTGPIKQDPPFPSVDRNPVNSWKAQYEARLSTGVPNAKWHRTRVVPSWSTGHNIYFYNSYFGGTEIIFVLFTWLPRNTSFFTKIIKKLPAYWRTRGSLSCSQEPATGPYLSQMNSDHILISCFFQTNFNINPVQRRATSWVAVVGFAAQVKEFLSSTLLFSIIFILIGFVPMNVRIYWT